MFWWILVLFLSGPASVPRAQELKFTKTPESTNCDIIVNTASDIMAAQSDERILRNIWKKCTEVEERTKFLESLIGKGVGLKEVEEFVISQEAKLKVGGSWKSRREIVNLSMKEKAFDNKKLGEKMRKKRAVARSKLELSVGTNSRTIRRIVKDIGLNMDRLRVQIRKENEKTINFLVNKYGKRKSGLEDWPDEVKKYESAKIFMEKCAIAAEAMKGPVIVAGDDELINLDDDETEFLSLGPKYCIFKNICEEEYENNVEQAILKYKWDIMGDEEKDKKPVDPAM